MKKKYPDNIVYNYHTKEFDANKKEYPTSVGGQNFKPIKVESRLGELKDEYKKLIDDYNWTSLVYGSDYNFQPIIGQDYYLYEKSNKKLFLSIIGPTEWQQSHVGTFKLLNNGKWEKI